MAEDPEEVLPEERLPAEGDVEEVEAELALELEEGVVVCILADAGWKYLSADFWETDDVATSMERTLWW